MSSSPQQSAAAAAASSFVSRNVSPLDRIAAVVGSAFVGFWDPNRSDMIALLGELTSGAALPSIRAKMQGNESGRRILLERPRIRFSGGSRGDLVDHESAASLLTLPVGSLGYEYGLFLQRHSFSPEERADVRFVQNEELAYVLQRYREVHDFWHVLAALPPTVPGEITIKWLEMVQTGLPVAALSALVAPLRLSRGERRLLFDTYLPWAIHTGLNSVHLMSVPYEVMLKLPLEQVRRDLKFPACPSPSNNA